MMKVWSGLSLAGESSPQTFWRPKLHYLGCKSGITEKNHHQKFTANCYVIMAHQVKQQPEIVLATNYRPGLGEKL